MSNTQNIRVSVPQNLRTAGPVMANTPTLQTVSGQTANATQIVAGSSGSSCATARQYGPPSSFTLIGASNVADQVIKMQGFDGVVESILGTQGTVVFTVSTLPDRTGLAIGGANLLGIDCLRSRLATFALLVGQINYDGGIATQLRQPINVLTGNLDGSTGKQVLNVDQYVNNMQQIASLVTITTPVTLTGNTLITMTKLATASIGLTLSNMQAVPYNDPSTF